MAHHLARLICVVPWVLGVRPPPHPEFVRRPLLARLALGEAKLHQVTGEVDAVALLVPSAEVHRLLVSLHQAPQHHVDAVVHLRHLDVHREAAHPPARAGALFDLLNRDIAGNLAVHHGGDGSRSRRRRWQLPGDSRRVDAESSQPFVVPVLKAVSMHPHFRTFGKARGVEQRRWIVNEHGYRVSVSVLMVRSLYRNDARSAISVRAMRAFHADDWGACVFFPPCVHSHDAFAVTVNSPM